MSELVVVLQVFEAEQHAAQRARGRLRHRDELAARRDQAQHVAERVLLHVLRRGR